MKSCLRNALCVVLLLGCLQAQPVRKIIFDLLIEGVTCEPHVKFTSPTHVLEHCNGAALTLMEEQLKTARTRCKCKYNRINQTLNALGKIPRSLPPSNSSECQWENEGSQKLFQPFVRDIENQTEKMYATVAP